MKEIKQPQIQKEVGFNYCPVCEANDVIFVKADNNSKFYECNRCGAKWVVKK